MYIYIFIYNTKALITNYKDTHSKLVYIQIIYELIYMT